jgi:hypothetical protein
MPPPGQGGTLHCLIDIRNRPVLTDRGRPRPLPRAHHVRAGVAPHQLIHAGLARGPVGGDGRGARCGGPLGHAGRCLRAG